MKRSSWVGLGLGLALAAGCAGWRDGEDERGGCCACRAPAPRETIGLPRGAQQWGNTPSPLPAGIGMQRSPLVEPKVGGLATSASASPLQAPATLPPIAPATRPALLDAPELPATHGSSPQPLWLPPVRVPQAQSEPQKLPPSFGNGPSVRLVSGKRLRISYEVKDGPAASAPLELWYTRDGKHWQRDSGSPQSRSPYLMEVPAEGLYGLILTAGTDGPSTAPRAGEPPQFWVAVDWSKPAVSLQAVAVDNARHMLTVRWSASDNNLGARPITLFYADKPGGPWVPFAANLRNTGEHTAAIPPGLPSRFVVRVEAADQVGNIGEAHLLAPISAGSTQANKAKILAVDFSDE